MTEKILLVDDDIETLRLVGIMLQRQGYQITAASSGSQALVMAHSENPDLIILDGMMPDIDGAEVTRRLRANPDTKHISIIMFTARSQLQDKIEGFEAGADDYLTKPTQPRELLAHVKAVLGRTTRSKAETETETETPQERGVMVGVLSVRGGLGVTSLALNLGSAIYQAYKQSVIVAEFRPGQGSISLDLGVSRLEGLNRLLECASMEIDANAIESELINHSSGISLLLASPRPGDARFINAVSNFETIARHLANLGRYVILDLGTSLSPINEKVLPMCDKIIVVVEPLAQTLHQTMMLIEDLNQRGIDGGRINIALVNRIRLDNKLSISQVNEQLKRTISVVFTPAPELAYQASINQRPMVIEQPNSLTAQQFAKLAEMFAH